MKTASNEQIQFFFSKTREDFITRLNHLSKEFYEETGAHPLINHQMKSDMGMFADEDKVDYFKYGEVNYKVL